MYRLYNRQYNIRAKKLYFFAFVLLIAQSGICYILTQNIIATIIVMACGLSLISLLVLMQKNDDIYFSNIVKDISELMDCLNTLENNEIFPLEEDTLVSKLQNQILDAIRMLKLQNERETSEHEKIKTLVSDISHQIKTPVTNLKVYTDFLAQDEITKEERMKYVQVLKQSMERLMFITEGMIKMSRLESGLISIDKKQTSINDTILMAIKNAYVKARDNQTEIKYIEEYTGEIDHDSRWTSEAIFNLLDNAVKYGKPRNTVTIRVRKLGASIEIVVEDENELISRDEYTAIFKRFYRGKEHDDIEGAGIGLYLTRDIIERQGGFVSVKKGEKGNSFSIIMK